VKIYIKRYIYIYISKLIKNRYHKSTTYAECQNHKCKNCIPEWSVNPSCASVFPYMLRLESVLIWKTARQASVQCDLFCRTNSIAFHLLILIFAIHERVVLDMPIN
jgi:hypothetical protein